MNDICGVTLSVYPVQGKLNIESTIGMGTIPIPSIDTVDTYKFGVSIDTATKYR